MYLKLPYIGGSGRILSDSLSIKVTIDDCKSIGLTLTVQLI